MPAIIFVLLIVACAGNLTNPNAQDGQDAQAQLSPEEYKKLSLQLFTDKVQLVIADLKCPTCHTQAVGQTPFFADSNADLAFSAIESKVNLKDLESSSLLVRIKEKHNCSVAGCEADAKALLEALKDWQQGLASAGGGEQHNFETTRLFPKTDAITNYDIGKLIDEQYSEQFSLQISMKKKGAPNSYQLNDLKIAINSDSDQGIFVKRIKILVNGSISDKGTSQILKGLACAVRFTQSLNESVTTIALDKAKDKLSFAFEEIRLANDDDQDCYSDRAMQRKFDSEIKPILEENCGECHAPSEENAQQTAPDFISFATVKEKRDLVKGYLLGQKDKHPGNYKADDLSDDEQNSIISWLQRLVVTDQ